MFYVEIEGYGPMAPRFETKKAAQDWARFQVRSYKWVVKHD
jgi:hypothetical protein